MSNLSTLAIALVLLAITPTPQPDYVLPMRYTVPLTNCWLESSTDLVHWQRDWNFSVMSNGDWRVTNAGGNKFYRVGGEILK